MNKNLPAEIKLQLQRARCSHLEGAMEKAANEYRDVIQYSRKHHQDYSAITGIVLLQAARFFDMTGKKRDAVILFQEALDIMSAYRRSPAVEA